jgi:1-phosphatidylinositol-3-phosphate 5-kinase
MYVSVTCDDPLYILPHSKTVLTQAINNDTQFLASQSVMDYSLLVGLDKDCRELVVGIIGTYCVVGCRVTVSFVQSKHNT